MNKKKKFNQKQEQKWTNIEPEEITMLHIMSQG